MDRETNGPSERIGAGVDAAARRRTLMEPGILSLWKMDMASGCRQRIWSAGQGGLIASEPNYSTILAPE